VYNGIDAEKFEIVILDQLFELAVRGSSPGLSSLPAQI
jgi:hypothetical protein